jgi:capsular polysaccharide biosynthesis protein
VAERIREKSDVTVSGPNRLLVLRQDAATRRLRNREAIKGALKPLNFEPVVLSRLTLKEQVERFASASVVVGPHGAGFTNIIYGEDIELLEIFGKYVNPCYYSICGGLGLGYNYLRGNQVEQDIHIDPTVVRAHAERLC